LLETCAALANALLRACPALCILASSREPLGVDGEVVYQVPSLPFSNAALLPPLAELGEFTSIRLFVDRARQVRPDYSLNEHNAAAVARICQRLDGIPLAIELAAARVRMLPARQIAARLDDRFDLLTGGSRTALPKHQTLRASIDWSYDLLTETEKTLLRRLAVFAGGWRLEAAEAIASGDGLAIARVLDLISHLVDKSLVQVDRSGAGADWRYHLLETVRQYALQRTDSAGERQELSRRHRDYFLALAEGRDQLASAREIHAWDQQMAADVDNLRLALEWSFEHLTPLEAGPRLTMLAGRVWPTTGEELAWAIRAVELCQHRTDLPAPIRADVISWGSGLMTAHHAPTSVAWSEQAVEISRSLGPAEQKRLVSHLHRLVYRHLYASRDIEKARAAFVEAEGILTARGRELWTAEEIQGWKPVFSAIKAEIANGLGDLKEAKRHAADSLRLFDTLDDLYASVDSRTLLADICTQLREYEEARTHFLVALRQSDEMLLGQAKPTSKAFLLRSLAHLEVRAGNLDAALCHCQAALREALSIPEHNIIASCLGTAAIIQARLENAAEAAMLAGASLTAYTSQGHKPWEDSSLDTLLPGWANGPDRAPIEAAFMAGQNQSAEEAAATLLQAVDEASLGRGPQALY
jgi:predicted ATPase